MILSRRFAKKKLLNFGSEVILDAKQRLHCRQTENRAISKTKAHFEKKTSDIEERETQSIELEASRGLEGLRFENRVNLRTHSVGVHFGQLEKLNGLDPIVGNMKSKRKIKSCVKTITVHSSSACDTLPSVE